MRVLRRFALLAGSLGLAVTSASLLAPAHAAPGSPAFELPGSSLPASGSVSVAVHGRLLVVPSEEPGGHTSYGVALADGDIVPVRGAFDPSVRTGAVFDGRLAVPASVTGALARRGPAGDTRRAALRLVDRRSLTLPVVGTPSVVAAAAPAVTGTVHRQFVAAIDNKGALGLTDAQLLTHVSNVGSYWEGQSNGAITGITVPATVKHYDTATGTTACGLGASTADFFNLVQEAAALFPAINLSVNSPDQLVLFVPPSCSTGTTVGRGTVGSSFAGGGELVAESSDSIEGVYAHETGHNYGFQHANARLNGVSQEYYGIYDVMGFALTSPPGTVINQLTSLSTPYRVFQGVTDPGEVQDVPLGDLTQPVHVTATIKPRSAATGMRSLSVVNPDTGERLYLDDRAGTGQDVGAAYAFAGGVSLGLGTSSLHYATGVTVTAARGVGGVDDLVLDAAGNTSLGAGGAWSNASGSLQVSVSSTGPTGAVVDVDFIPSTQDFTTVGSPVIGGNVAVGGAVTLDTGTWAPTPTTTTIRWTADGSPVANTNDKTSFVPAPALVGKQLVATVTASKPGFRTTAVQSPAVTVSAGTIPVTGAPGITGSAQVGFVLHAQSATWGTTLSTVTGTWQWRVGGVDVPGATATDYTVRPVDVGKTITVSERLSATGYTPVTSESLPTATVPDPVISPAPTPTVDGSPRVGDPLTAQTGTWMSGVTLGLQWYVGGQPVAGATGTSYTPRASDLGRTVRVEVTGSRLDYPDATRASTETAAVAPGVLSTAKPTIGGTPTVGKTLTARPGTWSAGTTFSYTWLADGVAIKGQTAKRLVLAKAQRGKRITVRVTGTKPGFAVASRTSARMAKVS